MLWLVRRSLALPEPTTSSDLLFGLSVHQVGSGIEQLEVDHPGGAILFLLFSENNQHVVLNLIQNGSQEKGGFFRVKATRRNIDEATAIEDMKFRNASNEQKW